MPIPTTGQPTVTHIIYPFGSPSATSTSQYIPLTPVPSYIPSFSSSVFPSGVPSTISSSALTLALSIPIPPTMFLTRSSPTWGCTKPPPHPQYSCMEMCMMRGWLSLQSDLSWCSCVYQVPSYHHYLGRLSLHNSLVWHLYIAGDYRHWDTHCDSTKEGDRHYQLDGATLLMIDWE